MSESSNSSSSSSSSLVTGSTNKTADLIVDVFQKTGDFFAERFNATLVVSLGAIAVDIAYHLLQKKLKKEALILHLQEGDKGRREQLHRVHDTAEEKARQKKAGQDGGGHHGDTFESLIFDRNRHGPTHQEQMVQSSLQQQKMMGRSVTNNNNIPTPTNNNNNNSSGASNSNSTSRRNTQINVASNGSFSSPVYSPQHHQAPVKSDSFSSANNNNNNNNNNNQQQQQQLQTPQTVTSTTHDQQRRRANEIDRCEECIRVTHQLSHRGVITLVMQNVGTGVTGLMKEVAKRRPSTTYISLAGAQTLEDVCILLQRELNLETEEKLPTTFFVAARLLRGLTGVLGSTEVTEDDDKDGLGDADAGASIRWSRLTKVLETAAEEAFHRNVTKLSAKRDEYIARKKKELEEVQQAKVAAAIARSNTTSPASRSTTPTSTKLPKNNNVNSSFTSSGGGVKNASFDSFRSNSIEITSPTGYPPNCTQARRKNSSPGNTNNNTNSSFTRTNSGGKSKNHRPQFPTAASSSSNNNNSNNNNTSANNHLFAKSGIDNKNLDMRNNNNSKNQHPHQSPFDHRSPSRSPTTRLGSDYIFPRSASTSTMQFEAKSSGDLDSSNNHNNHNNITSLNLHHRSNNQQQQQEDYFSNSQTVSSLSPQGLDRTILSNSGFSSTQQTNNQQGLQIQQGVGVNFNFNNNNKSNNSPLVNLFEPENSVSDDILFNQETAAKVDAEGNNQVYAAEYSPNIAFCSVPLIIFDDATDLDEKAYHALATFAHNISSNGKFRVAFVVSSPYPFFATRFSHSIKILHIRPPTADTIANFIFDRCPFLRDESVSAHLVERLTGRNLGIANMLCMKLEEILCDSEIPLGMMDPHEVTKTIWFSAIRQYAFATTRPLHLYSLQPVGDKDIDEERWGIFRIAILLLEHEEDHELRRQRRKKRKDERERKKLAELQRVQQQYYEKQRLQDQRAEQTGHHSHPHTARRSNNDNSSEAMTAAPSRDEISAMTNRLGESSSKGDHHHHQNQQKQQLSNSSSNAQLLHLQSQTTTQYSSNITSTTGTTSLGDDVDEVDSEGNPTHNNNNNSSMHRNGSPCSSSKKLYIGKRNPFNSSTDQTPTPIPIAAQSPMASEERMMNAKIERASSKTKRNKRIADQETFNALETSSIKTNSPQSAKTANNNRSSSFSNYANNNRQSEDMTPGSEEDQFPKNDSVYGYNACTEGLSSDCAFRSADTGDFYTLASEERMNNKNKKRIVNNNNNNNEDSDVIDDDELMTLPHDEEFARDRVVAAVEQKADATLLNRYDEEESDDDAYHTTDDESEDDAEFDFHAFGSPAALNHKKKPQFGDRNNNNNKNHHHHHRQANNNDSLTIQQRAQQGLRPSQSVQNLASTAATSAAAAPEQLAKNNNHHASYDSLASPNEPNAPSVTNTNDRNSGSNDFIRNVQNLNPHLQRENHNSVANNNNNNNNDDNTTHHLHHTHNTLTHRQYQNLKDHHHSQFNEHPSYKTNKTSSNNNNFNNSSSNNVLSANSRTSSSMKINRHTGQGKRKQSISIRTEEEEEVSMTREALGFSRALDVCPLRVWLRLIEQKRQFLPFFVSFDTVLFRAPLYRLAMIEVVGSRRNSKTRKRALEALKELEESFKKE